MKIERSVCTACGFAGGQQKNVPGSFAVEFILWCFLAVPGLIYSIWRLSSVHAVCPSCSRDAMIPYPTPRARELLADRGGWSSIAEANFMDAAKREWRGLVGWTLAFAWFWVAVWGSSHSEVMTVGSLLIAVPLTAMAFVRFPSAKSSAILAFTLAIGAVLSAAGCGTVTADPSPDGGEGGAAGKVGDPAMGGSGGIPATGGAAGLSGAAGQGSSGADRGAGGCAAVCGPAGGVCCAPGTACTSSGCTAPGAGGSGGAPPAPWIVPGASGTGLPRVPETGTLLRSLRRGRLSASLRR